jgi:hypothetical protein
VEILKIAHRVFIQVLIEIQMEVTMRVVKVQLIIRSLVEERAVGTQFLLKSLKSVVWSRKDLLRVREQRVSVTSRLRLKPGSKRQRLRKFTWLTRHPFMLSKDANQVNRPVERAEKEGLKKLEIQRLRDIAL